MNELGDYLIAMKQSIEFLDSDLPVENKIKTVKSICQGFVTDVENLYKTQNESNQLLLEINENLKLLNQRVNNLEKSIM